MNIFDQYGIKEVADVTLYSIHKKKDGSGGTYCVPALFLDTLKISSTEKTAENVSFKSHTFCLIKRRYNVNLAHSRPFLTLRPNT